MLGICIQPILIESSAANDGRTALRALASAAGRYLEQLEEAVADGLVPVRSALVTRVRGTGPGVSFGSLVEAIQGAFPLDWSCPFEGSHNVSGASLPIADALGEQRDDGFLFLRFEPGTRDLPLHIHPQSDRFIFVIGGRGFFHLTDGVIESIDATQVHHMPARDRDALMFRRSTVHTFSTAEHPLLLLSYHRPFVPLDEPEQYTCSAPPLAPAEFLDGCVSRVSFDAAWTMVAREQAANRLSSAIKTA